MEELRIQQLKDGTEYVRNIFGRDCAAVLVDREGDKIVLYINRKLAGYEIPRFSGKFKNKDENGVFVREFGADSIKERHLMMFGYYPHFNEFDHKSTNGDFETTFAFNELRRSDAGYVHVPSRRFLASIGRYNSRLNFPEESVIVHEMTHGLCTNNYTLLEIYGDCITVEESLALFVELSYLKTRHPEHVARWIEAGKVLMEHPYAGIMHFIGFPHAKAYELLFENSINFHDLIRKLRIQ